MDKKKKTLLSGCYDNVYTVIYFISQHVVLLHYGITKIKKDLFLKNSTSVLITYSPSKTLFPVCVKYNITNDLYNGL